MVEFKPVTTRRAFEQVIFQIEDAVLSGRLLVGHKLPPERELADQFQVSRSSVREALRVLEMLGLVTARRGAGDRSGSFVQSPTSGLSGFLPLYVKLRNVPLGDLVAMRLAIETMTATGAANVRAQIDGALLEIDRSESPEEFLDTDTRFHLTIARGSANAIAPVFMEALREAMAREMLAAFRLLNDWPAERRLLVQEHRLIASLIAQGNASAASQAMSNHIRGFYARAIAMGA